MTNRILIALLGAFLASGCVSIGPLSASDRLVAGQHAQEPIENGGYPYQLYIPDAAAAAQLKDGKDSWPLMIFLHGSGERGDEIAKVKVHGPPKIADMRGDFPFILISPLLPADQDWDLAKLDRLLDHALANLPVDRRRIYLTGLSRGGHATWRWAAAEPTRFAAIAPVAGRGVPAVACALKDIPVWAFHGDRDDVVEPEGSFAMSRAIRTCGGQRSRLTIYPDRGHDAWNPAYDDPELYLWLLAQRRASPSD